uniref:Uncharacterized protein n=1 Tax=Phlebotomus papatasi TaxID=29031 RepID=A0A1B0DRJ2_PHLPP
MVSKKTNFLCFEKLSVSPFEAKFCGLTEKILRHIGFIRLSDLSALNVIVWIAPELVLLLASIGVYFILKMMANGHSTPEEAADDSGQNEDVTDEPFYTVEKYNVICTAAKILSMAALLLASVMRPSVPSGVYFLMFLALATWWACYGKLESWLTFILLIWANVLWIIPNQRKTMLQSSPFVVIYAELLLLAQYIYGMDLNEDELPATTDINGISLSQIGLVKETYLPCIPLIRKTIFTLMFWVTLRQRTKERREQRQTSTLADMVAPLQVTVGAATADLAPRADDKAKESQFITKAAIFFDAFLTRFWIWIVVITLFASGIAGQRMTGFRIIYMALFLVFLLTFQVSWKAWKKMMYGFWLTVIIYAMVILVLVYTYQFDRFPQYWSEYLNISETLQGDIGLEKYETRDLFLHLAIPTIVVVMTVLQLHYFHSKFLAVIEPLEGVNAESEAPNPRQYENLDESDESPKNAKGKKSFFSKLISISGISKSESNFNISAYPWSEGILKNLQMWAMLPDAALFQTSMKIIPDFILLMLVTRQRFVFKIEREWFGNEQEFPGGTNKSILSEIEGFIGKKFENPTPDFTSNVRNWLDVLKRGFVLGFFWLALAIVFLTGANRVNLFSVGYLVGSFTFLWQGSDFYLRPVRTILRWWLRLIAYNVFVVTAKTVLQIPGCLFYKTLEQYTCWLIQLLSIVCTQKLKGDPSATSIKIKCTVNTDQADILWDVICFAFLVIQYRIFQSYYFCHVVNETKAGVILASRGAELIEELRQKKMKQEMEAEARILKKLKFKMDRIKATQKKLLVPVVEEPKTHAQAIRSGDYYMFEDLDDELELDLLAQPKSDDDVEDQQQEKLQKKMGLGEVSSKLASKHREDVDELDREKAGPSRQTHAYKSPSDSDDDDDPTERQHLKRSSSEDTVTEMDEDDERPRGRLVGFKLIWAFIEGAMISLIIRLNRISRHYRYVVRVLAREKIELKNSPDFGIGRRAGNMMWIPQRINSEHDQSTESSTTEMERRPRGTVSEADVRVDTENDPETEDRTEDEGLAANYAALQQAVFKPKPQEEEEEQRRESVVPEIRILAPSLERGLDEVTPATAKVDKPKVKDRKFKVDEIEDFSEKEHSSIVELLMACWFAILSNTDLVCYFVVFINQINSASILSLPLPFMVFCWGTLTVPRPSKTFWVTLIAYTQIVVLLKCVSQFELLWWNEQAIPPNTPLAPARIIGIEKKKNYATYDLALLLVLFFHRFMLKTLGLWKSDFKEEPLSEGTYQVNQQSGNQDDKALVKKSNDLDKKTDETGSNQAIAIAKVHTETLLCPSTDMQLVQVTDVKEQPTSIIPPVVKLSFNRHCSAFRIFFGQLLDRSSRVSADVYAYMFFCDFINFMVVLFGFTSFGSQQGDGGVTAYLEENKVPLAFLIMLILQFVLIIIDRALYLRKFMLGKIIFQYGLTVGIHVWMFFILPAVTERSFNAKNPPVIWYLIKCFYLLFSAYQIRCGYPTRILGNFLTKSFNFVNLAAYKAYIFIPFLFELRTLMDWIWTDTSMTLFDWLKMEDIFANMYQLKCSRKMESDFPAPRGSKKTTLVKYLMGGGMLFGLITIIWFPLGLFALGNTVGESNPPFDVSVSMKIGPFEPIYFANAQGSNIQKFTEDDWLLLNQPYKRDKTAVTFLTNYEAADVAVVDLGPNSTSVWAISPPDLQRMREDIESQDTLKIVFRYTVSRITYSKENPGVITDETSYDLTYGDPIRQVLSGMLSNQTAGNVSIPHLLPKFLKVKNNGVLKPIPQLIPSDYEETAGFRNITLKLFEADNVRWWELKEDCTDSLYTDILKDIPGANCDKAIVIYTFNDKLFPPTLSYLTGGGIIGMYTTFVIVISRVIRGIFSGSSFKIMFDDLPYVDRVLQLCLDIYLVRESLEFALEEDLFAKLIFLYRSPETMIKWTRPKEEETHGGDDDDTSSMRSSSKAVRRKAA